MFSGPPADAPDVVFVNKSMMTACEHSSGEAFLTEVADLIMSVQQPAWLIVQRAYVFIISAD